MRRIRLFLTVAVIMAALSAFTAAPAIADDVWWGGWHDAIDIDGVTDWDYDDGVWEFEAEGEFRDQPAEFEGFCTWLDCWVTEVDLA